MLELEIEANAGKMFIGWVINWNIQEEWNKPM